MNLRVLIFLMVGAMGFVACGDDDDGPVVLPPVAATVAPEVGGPDQPNQVYIDLSTNTQTVVPRRNWDLGFSTDENFRVVLNGSNGMLAAPTMTNEFADVDTAQLNSFPFAFLNMDAIFGLLVSGMPKPVWFDQAVSWADYPNGELANTAIAEVSSIDGNNPVYIVSRGKSAGYMKIKITRTSNGFTLLYGDLNDQTGETLSIEKDAEYNFIFVSFDQGVVQVEPKKADWDICFSTYTDHVPSEETSGFPVPYSISDFIFMNRFATSAAVVDGLTTTLEDYQSFMLAGVTALNEEDKFSANISTIGSTWRTLSRTEETLKDDRFYVVNDSEGKNYKLLLTRLASDSGERGNPEFIYEELR